MEGDWNTWCNWGYKGYFNPLPPHGGRRSIIQFLCGNYCHFNPLPPHGGRLKSIVYTGCSPSFQSTPSAWRETAFPSYAVSPIPISIHSLRMEGDVDTFNYFIDTVKFQSTPSAWRETAFLPQCAIHDVFQSTPSAWRETTFVGFCKTSLKRFQSTPSAWRETERPCFYYRLICISIHSLRMEGDGRCQLRECIPDNFNPLPPHGGRLSLSIHTAPARSHISIHSLRMEGDTLPHIY